MERVFLLVAVLGLSGCEGCGYTSIDNKMTGQVKKIHHNTPIVCENYYSADVSLGVMQNGAGSISNHDVRMAVYDDGVRKTLEDAATTGKLVEITFKERRATTCIPEYIATEARLLAPSITEVAPTTAPKNVHVTLNGHDIDATVTNGQVTTLKLDGKDTPVESAAGKAAARVILATDAP